MTGRCDSNPAQYERNRRFGHLVHALARAGGGAKLPSVGLCLNASKAVSCLVEGCNDITGSSASRKAQNNVTLLGAPYAGVSSAHGPRTFAFRVARALNIVRYGFCRIGAPARRRDPLATSASPLTVDHGCISIRCRNSELSADDLRTWRGVVLGRAVSTLRSVETLPLAWGFVLVERRDPVVCGLVLRCVRWFGSVWFVLLPRSDRAFASVRLLGD